MFYSLTTTSLPPIFLAHLDICRLSPFGPEVAEVLRGFKRLFALIPKGRTHGEGEPARARHSVDGKTRNPARFNQLRLEVYPVIYRV